MSPCERSESAARRRRGPLVTPGRVALLWAVVLAPLLSWGLPDQSRDDLLFGGGPPWPAERYRVADDLARLRERDAGADTDLNPLSTRDRLVELTPNDAARAEILRRYRLFSRQPDEMIIFRALQRMNPRGLDLDPRLYQYGGGYIYLIGVALGVAGVSGLVHLTGNGEFYLAHPEAFARFYVVARVISLTFGGLTLVAVHRLARRAGGRRAGWLAFLCVAACPVFITAVLEAKPHLPAACMILWATLSALDYHARRRMRDAVRMGVQAGYAAGLVLTGLAVAVVWPALALTRRRSWTLNGDARSRGAPGEGEPPGEPRLRRPGTPRPPTGHRPFAHGDSRVLLMAAAIALVIFVATNPYLFFNVLTGRGALHSNLANSMAMYKDQAVRAGIGALRVGELLIEGAGVGVPLFGLIGLIVGLRRRPTPMLIACSSGVAMLVLCVLLAANKPAEFARFLILPVLLLSCAAAWCLAAIGRRRRWLGGLTGVLVLLTMRTPAYLHAFIRDAHGANESRLQAGRFLQRCMGSDNAVGVLQEPAPYAVPPLDFAHRRVILLPPARPLSLIEAELPPWLVFTADDDCTHDAAWWKTAYRFVTRFPTTPSPRAPITWADKPVFIYQRAAEPAEHRIPPAQNGDGRSHSRGVTPPAGDHAPPRTPIRTPHASAGPGVPPFAWRVLSAGLGDYGSSSTNVNDAFLYPGGVTAWM
ncbi:MAG: glycosyltransferase family 39 protein [Planctomycetota bacterium]